MKCKVIQDLLPLYHDGVCSEESRALVEEHLKTCEICAEELRLMKEELLPVSVQIKEEEAMKSATSTWKKGKRRAVLKSMAITCLLVVALVLANVAIHWCLTKDLEKLGEATAEYFGCESLEVIYTREENQYIIVLCKDEQQNGYWCLYQKDSIFHNRGTVVKGEKIEKSNKIYHVTYDRGTEKLLILYGFDLELENQRFEIFIEDNIYYHPASGPNVASLFFYNANETIEIVTENIMEH